MPIMPKPFMKGLWPHELAVDIQALLEGLLIDGVRDRNDQVGHRVGPDDLLGRGVVGGGDLDVIAAEQVGAGVDIALDLAQQQPQHGGQADADHLRQLHRLFLDLLHADGGEGVGVHDQGQLVTVAEELQGILQRRVRVDALFQVDLLLQLLLDLADRGASGVVLAQAGVIPDALAGLGDLDPGLPRRELDRRLVGERNVRLLHLEHGQQIAFLAGPLHFLDLADVVGGQARL